MLMGPNTLEEMKDMDGSLDSVQVRTEKDLAQLRELQEQQRLPLRLSRIDQLQEQLEQALDMLAARLGPVLRANPLRPGLVAQDPEEPETELAGWMQSTAQRLAHTVDAVREMALRVDL